MTDNTAPEERIAIIYDGTAWHVRRIRLIEHDQDLDEKIYHCDKAISNDHPALADVPQVKKEVLGQIRRDAELSFCAICGCDHRKKNILAQIGKGSRETT